MAVVLPDGTTAAWLTPRLAARAKRPRALRARAVLGALRAERRGAPRREGDEAADCGEAGADHADGGLDVRPERGLVDEKGERGLTCGISRVDVEEDDNTVDACEAHTGVVSCVLFPGTGWDAQAADGEDATERELILPRALEPPDDGQGQGEDDEVHDDVEGLVDDEVLGAVDAHGVDGLIPVATKRPTLQRAGEEDGGGPEADEPVYVGGEAVEGWGGEDAAVEADDGDFDHGTESEVGELVRDEDLGRKQRRKAEVVIYLNFDPALEPSDNAQGGSDCGKTDQHRDDNDHLPSPLTRRHRGGWSAQRRRFSRRVWPGSEA
ncbi:hypothetical protein V492_02823 [Pseudogymnoascus sp. VKM F-4246]|nr:hypothetical protein V492_02823 [Pseudogymnoascus sp. VKM F-4246]